MNPFLAFRVWMRKGPVSEQSLTIGLVALVLCLVAAVVVPTLGGPGVDATAVAASEGGLDVVDAAGSGADADATGATGQDAGTAAAEGGAPAAASSGSNGGTAGSGAATTDSPASSGSGSSSAATGSTPRGTTTTTGRGRVPAPGTSPAAGAAPATAATCTGLRATDQGVTAKAITVGAVLVDLGAANGTINLPSAADQKKAYEAAAAAVNEAGGIRCRRLTLRFYSDNPLDASAAHATCLQIQQDKVFAVFNNLFAPQETTCIAKAKIPNVWYTPPHTPDVRKYAPYILSWQPDYDQLIRHYVRGARSRGWFKGLKKVGILQQSCYPDENKAIRAELKAIGVDPGKASVFDYGCSGAPVSSPDQDQAAALQFKREGVTHVLNVAYGSVSPFSAAADQQAYRPQYAMMEDAAATAIQSGTTKPGRGFDGALLVSTIETGANNTPGYTYNAATEACARQLKKVGLPAPQATDGAKFFGIACVNVSLFKAAAEGATDLLRARLGGGLARAGQVSLSFPAGPLKVSDPTRPTGGQLWRPGRWLTSCQCWHVTDVHYRPGY